VQARGAFAAQPNQDSRGVNPVKGGYLFRHFHGFRSLQPLQRLHKKHPVVLVPVRSVLSMYAFSFKHKLLLHKEGPSPRAAPRELRYSDRKPDPYVGCSFDGGEKQGRANQEIFKL
jgi:hypothetical protein